MTDRILATISLLGLVVFVAIVVGFVRELDLILVITLCMAIAANDFWTTFRNGDRS